MTRALILAAGQGKRLHPLTEKTPKCLVPFLGKSLLKHQIKTLQKVGIYNINIATGFCAEQIEALGYRTLFNSRFSETNMVETLFCALDFMEQKDDLVIAYGDIVYKTDNIKALLNSCDEISLMVDVNWKDLWAVRMENPLDDAETLVVDKNNSIIELGKKPVNYDRIHGQYTGLIKIRKDIIPHVIKFYQQLDRNKKYDGHNFSNMYMTNFLQLLIDFGYKVKAVMVRNGWLEIDTVEDIQLYELMAEKGLLNQFYEVED